MSTSHPYNTRSKKKMDADPIPIPSHHNQCCAFVADRIPIGTAPTSQAHHNTRSTNFDDKTRKTGLALLNKALNTSPNSNNRVEKMIEFMRWIRTHKRLLESASFKRICYKKCHKYLLVIATSTIVSKRVKSKLRKSLVYECSLILDIIENEF